MTGWVQALVWVVLWCLQLGHGRVLGICLVHIQEAQFDGGPSQTPQRTVTWGVHPTWTPGHVHLHAGPVC